MGINHQKIPNSLVFNKNPHVQNFNLHQFTKVLKKVNSVGGNAGGGGEVQREIVVIFFQNQMIQKNWMYYESKTEVDGYCLLSQLVGEQDKFEIEGTAMERNELCSHINGRKGSAAAGYRVE